MSKDVHAMLDVEAVANDTGREMMIAWTQIGWGLAVLLAVLATVAEVRTKSIPNGLVYPFIAIGIALVAWSTTYWLRAGVSRAPIAATCVGHVIFVGIGVVGPLVAWRRGIAGGGVVKLALALSLLLPPEGAVGLLVVSVVMGVVSRFKARRDGAPTIDGNAVELYATPYILVVAIASVFGRGMLIAAMFN